MATKRFVTKHGLDNNNQTITNVANPSTDTDAANKQWVTSQISNSGGGTVTSIGSTTLTTGGTSTVPTVNLTSGIVTAGTTGSASLIPVVTVDTYGRVTTITTAANPQGTVTSVTGTSPVVSSGGAAPVISMSAASSGVNGYMTGTYATKLDGIATGATDNTGTVTSITTTGANGVTISGGSTQTITTSGTFALALGAITPTSIVTGTGSFSGDVEFASSIKSPNASNSPITIAPDGTGDVHLNTDSVRIGDNNADATIATRGTGDLIITTHEGSANEGIVRLYDGVNGDITLTPNGSGQVKVGTDQVVTLVASQTLTNKTLTSPTLTTPALGTPASGTLTNCTFPTLNQNTTGSAGSVANTLTISSPLSGTSYNGSSAVSIGIPVATTSVNGYLSSTDWTTFNNKGSGTVTSVTGTSPVVSSGGATPAISIPVATTSVSGYLSSTDWTTFNNKTSNTGTVTSVSGAGTVSGLTLTGTVTGSGSITLGGTIATLNQNTTGSAGSVPASGITGSTLASGVTASSLTSVGTLGSLTVSGRISVGDSVAQIYQDGTRLKVRSESTDDVVHFASYGMYLPKVSQTYNLYLAEGMQMGYGTANPYLSYRLGDLIFRSDATERMRLTAGGSLGIGTSSPQSKFHIGGDGAQTITTPYDITFNHYYSSWGANATRTWLKKSWNATYNDFTYLGVTGNNANTVFGALILSNAVPFAVGLGVEGGGVLSTEYLRVSTAGNLGVGTVSPSYKLDVTGTLRVTDRIHSNEWIQFTNNTGLYSPTNSAHFLPNASSYGSWKVLGSRNGWCGLEFETSSNGNVSLMIAQNGGTSGFHNNSVGWQMRWNAGTIYCNKGSHGAGTEATVLDSSNYSSYALPNNGSWLGDLGSYGYTRQYGFEMTGGSAVSFLYKSGQGSILVDGNFIAFEGGGFYSSSNSSGGTMLGMKTIATNTLEFNARASYRRSIQSSGGDDFYIELTAPNPGNTGGDIGLRFHSEAQWWRQIRANVGGFRFTQGSDNSTVPITASNITAEATVTATSDVVHYGDRRIPRTFVSSTTPTGTISDGDVWLQY